MRPQQADIIIILTDWFNYKNRTIAEAFTECNYDESHISRVKSGERKLRIDSNDFYEIIFSKLPQEKGIEEKEVLLKIVTYLKIHGLMTPDLDECRKIGYEYFVRALLSIAFVKDKKVKKKNTAQIINSSSPQYNIVAEEDIRHWGWTPEYQVAKCMELDYVTIDALTPEHEGDMPQWIAIVQEHGETWRLLVDNEKQIIGYWHFIPLFPEDYKLAESGQLFDGNIRLEQIPPLFPGEYDIYFISICIKVQYQKNKAILVLLESIRDAVVCLATQGIFFRKVCTLAYTDNGKALCKHLKFQLHKVLEHGDIYANDMLGLLKTPFLKSEQTTQLIDLYTNHFSETESASKKISNLETLI